MARHHFFGRNVLSFYPFRLPMGTINKNEGSKSPSDAPENTGSTIMVLPSLESPQSPDCAITPGSDNNGMQDSIKQYEFKIRVASLPRARREAGLLVQQRYAQRGYSNQQALGENPNRMTVVAYEGSRAIGTVSIGLDSAAGLLSDDLYRAEIDVLRAAGRKVCEFIKLAVNAPPSASLSTLAALFHVAFIYAHRVHHCDDVVLEINPRHVTFYRRALGMKQLGPKRDNLRVNAPAVLMHGEFTYIAHQIEQFRGNADPSRKEKSFYSYGFSEQEERDILRRLQELVLARRDMKA